MIYAQFKDALLSLKSKQHNANESEKQISKIVRLIGEGEISPEREEFELAKRLGGRRILAKFWSVDKAQDIPLELWMKFKTLEMAAQDGDLDKVIDLLEDDALKKIAARNENQVLRYAARGNHQEVVDYLLNIPTIASYFTSIEKYDAQCSDRQIFLSHLQSALSASKICSRNDYLKLAFERLWAGKLFNVDHKFLLLLLSDKKSGIKDKYVSMVSYLCVMPSVRQKAKEDPAFAKTFSEVKAWLRSLNSDQPRLPRPKTQAPEHVGNYVVRLGVSAFNLSAYEQFLAKKADEEWRKKYFPEEFVPKQEKTYGTLTIINGKIRK
ncbi:MAG: hypothetical protein AB7V32_04710 [Candidatus Berkiella sp.]